MLNPNVLILTPRPRPETLNSGVCDVCVRECAAVDPVVVEMANHFWYIESRSAMHELGYAPRDWRETLKDSVRYIVEYGHLMVRGREGEKTSGWLGGRKNGKGKRDSFTL